METFYKLYQQCNKVVIDSRKIGRNDIFFAFSGENFDAATLATKAFETGALAVIVENQEYEDISKNIFYVSSTLTFLQELALHHRKQLKIPVISITGSNGKTTTKELIYAVLSKKFNVQYTQGNLNNHIGVPLTLLSIKQEHEIAVVEMGANHQQEINFLSHLSKPDIGYITNFGKAHLEGFGGFEGVIKGKSELYDYLISHHKVILVNENDLIQSEKTKNYNKKITFGDENSDYFYEEISQDNFVGLRYKNQTAQSNLTGNYNFTNLCAAASFGLHFGIDFQEISSAIQEYIPTNMRSQVIEQNGKTLVLDTYNANPSSMKESLKNFSKFIGTKTIIIGDMLELGEESATEHSAILELAYDLRFDEIITVGEHFLKLGNEKGFSNSAELGEFIKQNPIRSKNILLKGSRGIALEKIIGFL